ncbi:MAG: N-acetylmuramoyl-L-alanine amidase [Candidatus Methanosuratincola sp.]|jgi:N-acetylmuramoyl-L-alanine amidase
MQIARILFLLAVLLPVSAYGLDEGDRLYGEALSLYESLTTDQANIGNKEIWDTIARALRRIYVEYPTCAKAPDSLFLAGKMYEEIGRRFNSKEAFKESIELSSEYVRSYPYSEQADDAQIRIARLVEMEDKARAYIEYEKVVRNYPNGDMHGAASQKLKELQSYKAKAEDIKKREGETLISKKKSSPIASDGRLAKVSEIRRWGTPDYTRIVIYVDKEVQFKHRLLKADPELNVPPRLFVDLEDTTVDEGLEAPNLNEGLLESIKFARNTPKVVRVVLYIKSYEDYKVFSLHEPFRIVMDIYGKKPPGDVFVKGESPDAVPSIGASDNLPKAPETLRDVLGLKVRTVVIDPGHGGHDPGAIGPTGVKEKDVNLAIAKALKQRLEQGGFVEKVVLTRHDDRFIPLEERTAIARKHKADLFISIHCNSSKNRNAQGIETYVLSFTKDPDALAVAARENATNTRGLSDLEDILKKYLLSSKIDESINLAEHVQTSLIASLNSHYGKINNKGVKKAPFVVLIGADVPSILIETSFISNPSDEKRLADPEYINKIAEGIVAGVYKYSNNGKTVSLD